MHARVRQMLETFYTYVYFVEQHGISVCQATNKYQVAGSSLKHDRNKLVSSYMYSAFRLTSFPLQKAYLCVVSKKKKNETSYWYYVRQGFIK